MNLSHIAWPAALVVASSASAQSFNIDFSPIPGTDGPSDSYAAAGRAGHWESIPAAHGTSTFNLTDIHGNVSPVRLTQIGGTAMLDMDDPATTGDDDIMMDDCLATYSASLESCLFFYDLVPGEYEILVYAMMPSAPDTKAYVSCDQEPGFPHLVIGGAWSGQHEEGATYSRHQVTVNETGRLYVHSGIAPGEDPGLGAALNGIQLRHIVPCPGDVSPVKGGDFAVNINDFTDVILNWGTAGPAGDTNGDGAVNITDYTNVVLGWGDCP